MVTPTHVGNRLYLTINTCYSQTNSCVKKHTQFIYQDFSNVFSEIKTSFV